MHKVIFELLFLRIQLRPGRLQVRTLCAGIAKSFGYMGQCLEHLRRVCAGITKSFGHIRQCREHVRRVAVRLHQIGDGFAKHKADLPASRGGFPKSFVGLAKSLGQITKSFRNNNAMSAPLSQLVGQVHRPSVEVRMIPVFVYRRWVEVNHTSVGVRPSSGHMCASFSQVHASFFDLHPLTVVASRPP